MAESKVGTGEVVGFMLRTAKTHEEGGNIYQAIATYFKLVEDFPGTDEASQAEKQLLSLAQELGEKGNIHMAMSIYNRLATPAVVTGVRPGFVLSPMGRSMGKPLLGKVLGPIL